MRGKKCATAIFAIAALFVSVAAFTSSNARAQKKELPPPKTTRLTIVVTGGDGNKPVAEASVYLKYVETGKHGKGRKFELNLKTNQEGETHSPQIPQGKVLIQIVAETWKTFGQYYDLQQDDQTVEIHLDRPNRLY
jgi:hypothetical protein